MLEMGWRQVLRAAQHLSWDSNRLQNFLAPERITEVAVPDPSTGQVVRALRIQHSTTLGPAKGGVRMTSAVSRTEVEALSLFMTLKTAAAGLPLGGGKGGIVVDAGHLNDGDRQELVASVAEALASVIGPESDVLGPDVGTGESEMAAIDRAWRKSTGLSGSPATGKPLDAGGLALRQGATARGLEIVFDSLAERRSFEGPLRFAVHGFGSVGRGIAERLCEQGHVLVGAADSRGAAIDENGLDLSALIERKTETGSVTDDGPPSNSVLELDCDVLIPAALQGVIDQSMAERLQADIILEGANGPCTWAGAEVLRARGITVAPDILANSGGVSASFEEMTEPSERDADDVVAKRFEHRLRDACGLVWETAEAEGLDYRTAATVVALRAQDA